MKYLDSVLFLLVLFDFVRVGFTLLQSRFIRKNISLRFIIELKS